MVYVPNVSVRARSPQSCYRISISIQMRTNAIPLVRYKFVSCPNSPQRTLSLSRDEIIYVIVGVVEFAFITVSESCNN